MANDDERLNDWFCREVLPCEPRLTRFILRHWRSAEEAADIRQEIYERTLIGASRELPRQAAPYLFSIARNHLINRHRRAQIVSFDRLADLETVDLGEDFLTPERYVLARDELRRVQDGLDLLPPRCREVIRLRKVYGLSTREVAERLGVGVDAVEQQTTLGMRALADYLLGGPGKIRRPQAALRRKQDRST